MGFFGLTAFAGPAADQVIGFPLQLALWAGAMALLGVSSVAILCSVSRVRRTFAARRSPPRPLRLVLPLRGGR